MSLVKKVACDFWGLNEKNYKFFNENGIGLIDDPNQIVTVDKHFEASRAKSSSAQK